MDRPNFGKFLSLLRKMVRYEAKSRGKSGYKQVADNTEARIEKWLHNFWEEHVQQNNSEGAQLDVEELQREEVAQGIREKVKELDELFDRAAKLGLNVRVRDRYGNSISNPGRESLNSELEITSLKHCKEY